MTKNSMTPSEGARKTDISENSAKESKEVADNKARATKILRDLSAQSLRSMMKDNKLWPEDMATLRLIHDHNLVPPKDFFSKFTAIEKVDPGVCGRLSQLVRQDIEELERKLWREQRGLEGGASDRAESLERAISKNDSLAIDLTGISNFVRRELE